MKISTRIQNIVQSVWDSVSRLFQPTDDDYPKSGVQPYSDDPCDDPKKYS